MCRRQGCKWLIFVQLIIIDICINTKLLCCGGCWYGGFNLWFSGYFIQLHTNNSVCVCVLLTTGPCNVYKLWGGRVPTSESDPSKTYSRGSSPDLSLKLRFNYFRTYQFLPRQSSRNRQTSLNPNVKKSLKPWHQSHPRVLTMSLLEGLPPPKWISLQSLQPTHRNSHWGHSYPFGFLARAP